MTWRTIARFVVPYVVCVAVGFGMAWKVQGLRVDALKMDVKEEEQKLTDYKNDQVHLKLEAETEAERRRKETANEWTKRLGQLEADHDTYRRCVAVGKCGARIIRVPDMPDSAGVRVPPTGRPDAAGPDAIPAAGEVAEGAEVLKDCARTTLQLNQLQDDIEKQQVK